MREDSHITLLERRIKRLQDQYAAFIESQQFRMSHHFEGLPLVALLGLICGVVSGGVIIVFRLAVETSLFGILGSQTENFESIDSLMRFLLCVSGGLIVGLLLHFLRQSDGQTGVVHVIERLEYHQGYLPLKNTLVQFVTAAVSLISGQSVGREGPSIHLGAGGGSLLGRILRVPNNSLRTLVGCGVAAAIAAAFNTPLAGVIFAMEVVLMEYTIIGFTPIILAAVSATTLTRFVFGDSPAFAIPVFELHAIHELPLVAILGFIIGCLAAFFIRSTLFMSHLFREQPIWVRTTLAGSIAGLIAMWLPQIMGTGYDTVSGVLLIQLGLGLMLILVIAKTLATASAIGLGIPAGLIGPTLYIGACAGASAALVFQNTTNISLESISLYAILGMAAMMAATLQAPLAALIYLLELMGNQAVILPGMIAVICASLTTRTVFKQTSIYRQLLIAKGLDYRNSPLSQALRRVGVASVLERQYSQHPQIITRQQAIKLLKKEPRWILIMADNKSITYLLPATDLALYINNSDENDSDEVDLLRIPAKRREAVQISIIATLQEAHERMLTEETDILYVTGAHGRAKQRIYGILTREHVESSYRF